MSLNVLLRDEFYGFYRSKVMLVMWVGMPILTVVLYFLTADDLSGVPVSVFAALIVSSIGGLLGSTILVVNIIKEVEDHVYDLFLIRPVKRRDLLVSKFLAVFISITLACFLAVLVGMAVDVMQTGSLPTDFNQQILDALVIMVSLTAITSSAGVLVGVVSPSLVVGIVLVLLGVNQFSSLTILPVLTDDVSNLVSLGIALAGTVVLMAASVVLFDKKRL